MGIFLLKCPKCKQNMKYGPRESNISGKTKKCVYCGFCMGVSKAMVKKI